MPSIVRLIDIGKLKPHEKIRPVHSHYLQEKIKRDGIFTHPIVVESSTLAILDGHHRVAATKRLGFKKIPALLVSYKDIEVSLRHHRLPSALIKKLVLLCVQNGELLPIKTTHHQFAHKKIKTKIDIKKLY